MPNFAALLRDLQKALEKKGVPKPTVVCFFYASEDASGLKYMQSVCSDDPMTPEEASLLIGEMADTAREIASRSGFMPDDVSQEEQMKHPSELEENPED